MASEILTTTFGDCRLVVPHGLQPPCDPPPGGGGGPGGPPPTLPSYEMDTENWADQEMGAGGGGIPQGGIKGVKGPKSPPSKGKRKPPEGEEEKGEEGEEGEGEGEEEKEGTGDKLADKLIDKYTKSHSADSDKLRDQMMNPEGASGEPGGGDTGAEMPWPESIPRPSREEVDTFWDKMRKDRRVWARDPRTRDKSQDPGYDPTIQPPGVGLGGSFMEIGIKPDRTGLWKKAVKEWFKSLPIPQFEDKWTREDVRLQSPLRQMKELTGFGVRLPARNVRSLKPKVARVLVLVDVSGSVFKQGVQEDFARILLSVPKDTAEITIFTFDDSAHGIQEGPFTPKTYNPKFGGGGTNPWPLVSNLMATPKYSNKMIDGYCMLTDGAFAKAPPGLIKKPGKWCFIMTSTYTSDAIPNGAKIIETFVDDPEYQKRMREGDSKEIMREIKVKGKT